MHTHDDTYRDATYDPAIAKYSQCDRCALIAQYQHIKSSSFKHARCTYLQVIKVCASEPPFPLTCTSKRTSMLGSIITKTKRMSNSSNQACHTSTRSLRDTWFWLPKRVGARQFSTFLPHHRGLLASTATARTAPLWR